MDWNDLKHFLALAREGSARGAGARLGVSHSTVLRRVEALEARLGTQLFDRHRDGYLLTEPGQRMLEHAEKVEIDMASLERAMAGQDQRLEGPVSLTCCDHWVSALLLEDLRGFCEQFPAIELRVAADSRPFDLSKREADIAVRVLGKGSQPPEHLLGTLLVPVVIASYVGTEHASALDPDLGGQGARWVGYDDQRVQQRLVAEGPHPALPIWGELCSLGLMVQAIRQGFGLGMLPTYVGDREAGLQRLQRPQLRHMGDIWLLSHPDLRANARLKAARACVAEALRGREALFRGEAVQSCTSGSR